MDLYLPIAGLSVNALVIVGLGGLVGAYASDLAFWFFGYAAYSVPLVLGGIAWIALFGLDSDGGVIVGTRLGEPTAERGGRRGGRPGRGRRGRPLAGLGRRPGRFGRRQRPGLPVRRHRGAEFSVAFVDVLDHAFAFIAAGQIQIDVRPLAAFFGKEAFKQ